MIKTQSDLAKHIEYALLKPNTTAADVDTVCAEAVRLGCYGVCVNPVHIKLTKWLLQKEAPIPICAVGFPTGATLPAVKVFEAGEVVKLGAREINMTINLAALLADDCKTVVKTIQGVIDAADGIPVKVVIEAGLLTPKQIARAGCLCVGAGVRALMTCSCYGPGKSTPSQVRILREAVGDSVEIIASGGVHGFSDAMCLLNAGADRISSSEAPSIIDGGMHG